MTFCGRGMLLGKEGLREEHCGMKTGTMGDAAIGVAVKARWQTLG